MVAVVPIGCYSAMVDVVPIGCYSAMVDVVPIGCFSMCAVAVVNGCCSVSKLKAFDGCCVLGISRVSLEWMFEIHSINCSVNYSLLIITSGISYTSMLPDYSAH